MKFLLQISVLLVISWQIKCQGNRNLKLKEPDCPVNMKGFVEFENSTDWICDCYDTYLYFPATDSCHETYRQGPCSPGNYLVLPPGELVAKCEKNPCLEDGLVPFQGSCARFNEDCGMKGQIEMKFVIDEHFQLQCKELQGRGFGIIGAPVIECKPGTRRISTGKCKPILDK